MKDKKAREMIDELKQKYEMLVRADDFGLYDESKPGTVEAFITENVFGHRKTGIKLNVFNELNALKDKLTTFETYILTHRMCYAAFVDLKRLYDYLGVELITTPEETKLVKKHKGERMNERCGGGRRKGGRKGK